MSRSGPPSAADRESYTISVDFVFHTSMHILMTKHDNSKPQKSTFDSWLLMHVKCQQKHSRHEIFLIFYSRRGFNDSPKWSRNSLRDKKIQMWMHFVISLNLNHFLCQVCVKFHFLNAVTYQRQIISRQCLRTRLDVMFLIFCSANHPTTYIYRWTDFAIFLRLRSK